MGRPLTNSCVERVQGATLEECWNPALARFLVTKQTGLHRELERYLRFYNEDRGRTPGTAISKVNPWS